MAEFDTIPDGLMRQSLTVGSGVGGAEARPIFARSIIDGFLVELDKEEPKDPAILTDHAEDTPPVIVTGDLLPWFQLIDW
ncbi:hypothetical protein V6Z90_007415 [Aspergillus fumigatus]|jgi:hypothetical protein